MNSLSTDLIKGRVLIVGGTFSENGGKSSYYVQCINDAAIEYSDCITVINGGTLDQLDGMMHSIGEYSVILWMPNIDNSVDKYLPDIKTLNPHALLITSKRAIEREYTEFDVVGRMLAAHANLGMLITMKEDQYNFNILDPLGNSWYSGSNITTAAQSMFSRVLQVTNMTRQSATRAGDAVEVNIDSRFLDITKQYAEKFANLVNAVNPNRFLGNVSTRCMSGFPSARSNNGCSIYVSRRNVDKATMSSESFVEVTPNWDSINYFGDNKPSVDTPIQMKLYQHYPNIKYIIHGHVYISGSPMTMRSVPCGCIEEFDEILNIVPDRYVENIAINLRGHGCLIMVNSLDFLENIMPLMTSRALPEQQVL